MIANARDLENAARDKLSPELIERLKLTDAKIDSLADGKDAIKYAVIYPVPCNLHIWFGYQINLNGH